MKTKTQKSIILLSVLIVALIAPAFVMPVAAVASIPTEKWVTTVVKPTCSTEGYTELWNTVTDWKGYSDYVPALGHVWGEFDYSQSRVPFDADPVATCEVCGWYGYVYSWEITTVEATCVADGYIQYENSGGWMGWIYDAESALGHDFGEFWDLDFSQSRVADILPHANDPVGTCQTCGWTGYVFSWEITEVEPTCTADGYTSYTANTIPHSGYEFEPWTTAIYNEGSALGHNWGEFDYSQGRVPFADPVATCERCGWHGYVYSWEITETEPTCTADGYTQYTRSDCWMGWTYDEGSALGHDFAVTDLGWGIEYKCERCGYATYIYADELYAAIEIANNFLGSDFSAYTEESVAVAKTWVEAKLGELYGLRCDIFRGEMTQPVLEQSLSDINIDGNIAYAQSLLVEKPKAKTSAEWCADIEATIKTAMSNAGTGKITDIISWEGKTTVITVTINEVDYRFTGGNGANSDKRCIIDGVTYTINIQGNGNWRVISSA